MKKDGSKARGVGTAIDQEKSLKAPQSIIHIKHKISLQQYKYWILLLQELREQMTAGERPDEDGFYSMPMARLVEYVGYAPKKSEIWADMLALKNETIAFNVLNKDGEIEKYGAGFISEWKVSNSFVRFKFPSFLENVMRGLEAPKAIFSILNWQIFNHFSGKYEAIIYKLCKDYSGIGRTPKMTILEFREYIGIDPQEYQDYRRLYQWCISSPIKKINDSELSDITVTPEFLRQGRKVIGLYFTVAHKKQQSLPLPEMEEITAFQGAKVAISPTLQAKYLEQRAPDEIALCIARANEYGDREAKAGRRVSYGALYRTAINEGWHLAQIERQALEDAKKSRQEAERQAEIQKRHAEDEAKQATAKLWDTFESMAEEQKAQIVAGVLEKASRFVVKDYEKRKLASPLLKAEILRVLKTE